MRWHRHWLGFGLTVFVAALTGCNASTRTEAGPTVPSLVASDGPKAVLISSREHGLGSVRMGDSGSHRFELKNEGIEPLEVRPVAPSTERLSSRVEGAPIAPGEVGYLIVEWKISEYENQIMDNVEFETNDASMRRVSVRILGRVPPPLRASESRLSLRNVKAGDGFERSVDVMSYLSDNLQVTEFKWLDPRTSEFVDIEIEPLPADHEIFQRDAEVKSAVRVWVRARPGMPSGPLKEMLSLTTIPAADRPVQITLLADVRGAIEIGPTHDNSYDSEHNVVDLGRVSRLSKKSVTFNVVANTVELGTDQVQLQVESIDPSDVLSVTIQQARPVGKSLSIPVELTLTGNGQSLSRLGPTPELLGHVVLSTNQPQHPRLEFYVKFAVTQ